MAVSDGAHVSLPAMASVVGLSTYHFCRAFKQSTGPPPHRHHAEDETFILLEGELTFRMGDQSIDATAGTTLFVPRGTVHSFRTAGSTPARMLFMYSPAGMEGMFAEIGSPGVRGQQGPPLSMADVEAMIGVSAKYNFSMEG